MVELNHTPPQFDIVPPQSSGLYPELEPLLESKAAQESDSKMGSLHTEIRPETTPPPPVGKLKDNPVYAKTLHVIEDSLALELFLSDAAVQATLSKLDEAYAHEALYVNGPSDFAESEISCFKTAKQLEAAGHPGEAYKLLCRASKSLSASAEMFYRRALLAQKLGFPAVHLLRQACELDDYQSYSYSSTLLSSLEKRVHQEGACTESKISDLRLAYAISQKFFFRMFFTRWRVAAALDKFGVTRDLVPNEAQIQGFNSGQARRVPRTAEENLCVATILRSQGKLQDALGFVNKGLRIEPSNRRCQRERYNLLVTLGCQYSQQSGWLNSKAWCADSKVIQYLSQAHSDKPSGQEPWLRLLLESHSKLDNTSKALEIWDSKRSIVDRDLSMKSLLTLGKLCHQNHRPYDATNLLGRFFACDGVDSQASCDLSDSWYAIARNDEQPLHSLWKAVDYPAKPHPECLATLFRELEMRGSWSHDFQRARQRINAALDRSSAWSTSPIDKAMLYYQQALLYRSEGKNPLANFHEASACMSHKDLRYTRAYVETVSQKTEAKESLDLDTLREGKKLAGRFQELQHENYILSQALSKRLRHLGESYVQKGHGSAALPLLQELVRLPEHRINDRRLLGTAQAMVGELDQAISTLRPLIPQLQHDGKVRSLFAQVLENRGQELHKTGRDRWVGCLSTQDYDAAIKLFKEAIDLGTEHTLSCYTDVFETYVTAERKDDALDLWNRLLKRKSVDLSPQALRFLGFNLSRNEALGFLLRYLDSKPQDFDAGMRLNTLYMDLASDLFEKGRNSDAISMLKSALKSPSQPTVSAARRLLQELEQHGAGTSEITACLNSVKGAINVNQNAVSLEKQELARLLYRQARRLMAKDDFDNSADCFVTAANLFDSNDTSEDHLITLQRAAIALWSDHPGRAEEYLSRFKALGGDCFLHDIKYGDGYKSNRPMSVPFLDELERAWGTPSIEKAVKAFDDLERLGGDTHAFDRARRYATAAVAAHPKHSSMHRELAYKLYNKARERNRNGLPGSGYGNEYFALAVECFPLGEASEAHLVSLYRTTLHLKSVNDPRWERYFLRSKDLGAQPWEYNLEIGSDSF